MKFHHQLTWGSIVALLAFGLSWLIRDVTGYSDLEKAIFVGIVVAVPIGIFVSMKDWNR